MTFPNGPVLRQPGPWSIFYRALAGAVWKLRIARLLTWLASWLVKAQRGQQLLSQDVLSNHDRHGQDDSKFGSLS